MDFAVELTLILVAILLNGFFAASEFALVSARISRLTSFQTPGAAGGPLHWRRARLGGPAIRVPVAAGTKVLEIDPRGRVGEVTGISERPRRIAESVLGLAREGRSRIATASCEAYS